MIRRQLGWFVAMLALVVVIALSAPAYPEDEKKQPNVAPEGADQAEDKVLETQEHETVETILRQQEEVLRGQAFSYDPTGRRDPFLSLMAQTVDPTERPPGAAGMLVAELDLAGVVQDRQGDVAMFIGSDNKGYFLRVGDAVYDGTVIGVDPGQGHVTFRQQVDDPRLIKPFRDVTKRLVPVEDGTDE